MAFAPSALPRNCHDFGAGHAQLETLHVVRRLHVLRNAQHDLATAQILAPDDVEAGVLLDAGFVFGADIAVIDGVQMRRVAHQVAGREDRVLRDDLGDILRRNHADFQIAALHRLDLGALAEQRAVEVNLHVECAGHRGFQRFLELHKPFRLPFLGRARGRDADDLRRGKGWHWTEQRGSRSGRSGQKGAAPDSA